MSETRNGHTFRLDGAIESGQTGIYSCQDCGARFENERLCIGRISQFNEIAALLTIDRYNRIVEDNQN